MFRGLPGDPGQKGNPHFDGHRQKEDIDKIRGLGLGADDYIVKPFSPSELVARVGAHIARYERLTAAGNAKHPDHVIAIGDLKIYPEQMRVTVKGKEVKLANKEFELLRFLAENPNIVFSKDTLFDRIWGMDSLGDAFHRHGTHQPHPGKN